jgi:hypothetical protein
MWLPIFMNEMKKKDRIMTVKKTMPSSAMLRRVTLVRTDVSEERNTSITDSCHPDDIGDTFLRNVGSYKNHTA